MKRAITILLIAAGLAIALWAASFAQRGEHTDYFQGVARVPA